MDKKVFSAVCLMVGSFIGAGFATGKEVIVFFSKYGLLSLPNSLMFGIVFSYVMFVFMMLGKDTRITDFSTATKQVMGRYEKGCNLFFTIMILFLMASMFSGMKEILKIISPNHYFLLYGLFFLLTIILSFSNLKSVGTINKICVPCIIVFLLSLCIFCPYKEMSIVVQNSICQSILSCFYYVSLNVMIAGFIMMTYSYHMETKQIKYTCIIGGGIITILLLVISVLFLFCNESVVLSSLPVVTLAFANNSFYGWIGLMMIVVAIITTLLSNEYVIKKYLEKQNMSTTIASVLPICLSFLLSFIGFEKIIGYCYPIIGFVGMLFSGKLCLSYFAKNRTKSFSRKQTH